MVAETERDEPLQLTSSPTVSRSDLREFDDSPEARRLRERVADLQLLDRLAFEGYAGKDYAVFASDLARYGITVIRSWCRSNKIFHQCANKGRAVRRRTIDSDLAEELALETVANALIHFREHVLIPRRWDPDRGASLETFFIGQCVLRFVDVYRSHFATEEKERRNRTDVPIDVNLSGCDPHPDDVAVDRVRIERGYAELKNDTVRCIVSGYAEGLPYADIAERCGTTEKSVRNRLSRMKQEREVG